MKQLIENMKNYEREKEKNKIFQGLMMHAQ